jgi:hypothetical protein
MNAARIIAFALVVYPAWQTGNLVNGEDAGKQAVSALLLLASLAGVMIIIAQFP